MGKKWIEVNSKTGGKTLVQIASIFCITEIKEGGCLIQSASDSYFTATESYEAVMEAVARA